MSRPARVHVSKVVSHALRHAPWLYELELDDEGWVDVDELLEALHARGGGWRRLGVDDLAEVIATSDKKRFELDGRRIRALYGHSVPQRLERVPAVPPPALYHGTSPRAWAVIATQGLVPMGRQYVHLSVDVPMAMSVGRRKAAQPVLLEVRSGAAADAGVPFYRGNDAVWLADAVPAEYVGVSD